MISTASIQRVYKKNGAPVCDIADVLGRGIYLGCPFAFAGPGTVNSGSVRLPAVGSNVTYLPYLGNARGAVVIGSILASDTGARFRAEDAEAVDPDLDYPTVVNLADSVEWNGGALWVLTGDGQIVLDTTESGQPVRVQLAEATPLRISQGGVEPTERVVLAGPALKKLNELTNDINDLKLQVMFLTNMLIASGAGAATEPALLALSLAVATKSYAPELSANAGQELEASAILISASSTAE